VKRFTSPAVPSAADQEATLIDGSGLFDAAWYAEINADCPRAQADPLGHFLHEGWRRGRWPNPYFDTGHYLRQNPAVARQGSNPLRHYLQGGEAAGFAPAPHFDLLWYRTRHTAAPGETFLRHFLERRLSGTVSPLPEFDVAYYLTTYPDIAAAGVDPFEHYLRWGYREGRNPSETFDTRFYLQRYLDGDLTQNPLLHYRAFRHILRLHTQPPPHEHAAFDEVRRFSRPGPEFEARARLPRTAPRRAKLLAFYLPQFHAIAENDRWWGNGFTEWTSVARGQPRFLGHYQPRIPRDLGHYTLDAETMRRQIAFARDGGLFGFVQYFYWFNGRRLLERPLEAFLADPTLDFPFCLMWANENWTRRWDGSDHEVLISQDYRAEDDAALIDCFARHFRDPRYIRAGGRPLLMIYRAGHIPDTARTLRRWRKLWRQRHGEAPLLVMAQSFDDHDPRPFGFDAAVEFPPHKLTQKAPGRGGEHVMLDPRANPQIFAYEDIVAASLAEPDPPYRLIKTAVPGWDNDARRQGQGLVIHGATPAAYQSWLQTLVAQAAAGADEGLGEAFVCINAWNEWAEGAYLEPDVHFGAAFLNATGRAATRVPEAGEPGRLLLIGHDAFPAGSQMLLLHLGRALRRGFGVQAEFLLLGGGALLDEYEAAAPTQVVSEPARLAGALAAAAARGFAAAIVNTAAAAHAVPALAAIGVASTLLVHEMPRLLAEKGLMAAAWAGMMAARRVVVAAVAVRDGLMAAGAPEHAPWLIRPQGCYRPPCPPPEAREEVRRRLGVPDGAPLFLAAGYGDLRKGFDIFLQAWRAARRLSGRRRRLEKPRVAFCWIGALDPAMRTHLAPEIAAAEATGRFFVPGYQDDPAPWFAAADVFLLTSREDPFPSVALEAMCAGLPVVAFEGGGGIPELLESTGGGVCVGMGDAAAMARAALALARRNRRDGRRTLAAAIRERFDFAAYAADVLAEARPDLASVSAAIPSCNYARYLPGRLASVFAQTHPVREVLFLDDASTDDSVAVARSLAEDWQRDLAIVENPVRSGSPFGQWARAVALARGEFLWIAEADDQADPALLARLAAAARTAPDIVLAACDSRSIDAEGAPVWPSYQEYYAASGAEALGADLVLPAREFARRFLAERNLLLNVSGLLWRRAALAAALDRIGDELMAWSVAGDWRVALEVLAESDGHVAWVAAPLNVHRRHPRSASAMLAPHAHLGEISRMHRLLAARLELDEADQARQTAYRATLAGRMEVTERAA
jgi:glycosyltransferase involved in cell wall biosynthesis